MQTVGEDCHQQSYSVVDSAIIARQDVAKGTVVTSQLERPQHWKEFTSVINVNPLLEASSKPGLESIGPTRDAAATVLLSGLPSDFLLSNCSSYLAMLREACVLQWTSIPAEA